jgi:hypothetical protein
MKRTLTRVDEHRPVYWGAKTLAQKPPEVYSAPASFRNGARIVKPSTKGKLDQ